MELPIFDWTSVLISAISAIIGGIIGTYCGAIFINRANNKKNKDARKIAIRGLDIFAKYKDKKYEDASNEFNVSLSRAEKRTILVALHKIGVPIAKEKFVKSNDYSIIFSNDIIKDNDISAMKSQISSGKYDHLFYDDPDEYFGRNALRDYKRSIAIKYLNYVFVRTKLASDKKTVLYPDNWIKEFTFGEMNIVFIIREKLLETSLYEETTGLPKQQCIQDIINEINIGLWDAYLDWAYEAFSNVQMQKNFANYAIGMMSQNQYNAQQNMNITSDTRQNVTGNNEEAK